MISMTFGARYALSCYVYNGFFDLGGPIIAQTLHIYIYIYWFRYLLRPNMLSNITCNGVGDLGGPITAQSDTFGA